MNIYIGDAMIFISGLWIGYALTELYLGYETDEPNHILSDSHGNQKEPTK